MDTNNPTGDSSEDAATHSQKETDGLARLAVQPIHDGMTVGLGTGRAASRGIHALAAKVRQEGLRSIQCVASSDRSAELARSLGLIVVPMREIERIDVLFDGVDELDPEMHMTKGAGGAMTREKIVAEAADLRIYLLDESKLVNHLGERSPLPVEVLEFALATAQNHLRSLGLEPILRIVSDDHGRTRSEYRTDEGNLVLDCQYGETSHTGELTELAHSIDSIPGVIGHGLFATQADVALIESEDRRHVEERLR